MCDMEVHEHVMVNGPTKKLKERLVHRNVEIFSCYIQKDNEYSNWEAQVWRESGNKNTPNYKPGSSDRRPSGGVGFAKSSLRCRDALFPCFTNNPVCLGFLDGIPGLIYCVLQGIQFFHIKAKSLRGKKNRSRARAHPFFVRTHSGKESHVRH